MNGDGRTQWTGWTTGWSSKDVLRAYRVGAWLVGLGAVVAFVGGTLAVLRAHKPFYGLVVVFVTVALCEVLEWLRTAAAWRAARR